MEFTSSALSAIIDEKYITPAIMMLGVLVTFVGIVISNWHVRKQVKESKEWNQVKTTQEICETFERDKIAKHWDKVEKAIVEENKPYQNLSPGQQDDVRRMLVHFENFSLKLDSGLLESSYYYDHFRGIIPHLFDCCVDFIDDYRTRSGDEHFFEGFVKQSKELGRTDQRLEIHGAKRTAGRMKSNAQIIRELARESVAQNTEYDLQGAFSVLIVVDVQQDFFDQKSGVWVPKAGALIEPLNKTMAQASRAGVVTVLTRDWHPPDHPQFKDHPEHCIENTDGAQFHPELVLPENRLIVDFGTTSDGIKPGYDPFENPALLRFIASDKVDTVYVCGIALEYCVQACCLGARKLDKKVVAVESLTVSAGTLEEADEVWDMLTGQGVIRQAQWP